MNASEHVDRIVDFCENLGLDVVLHDFDLEVMGRYDHDKRQIRINEPSAELALATIAHELGHYVGYMLRGSDKNRNRSQVHRERQAYIYGWQVIKWFGADSVVARRKWIEICQAAHEAFREKDLAKNSESDKKETANASSRSGQTLNPVTVLSDGVLFIGGV